MRRYGPDSVRSWLSAVCCSCIGLQLYGVVRLSGALFVASMDRFQVDRQAASFPYILCDFMQATVGPFTGLVALKFGTRPVLVFGCLLSAVGIALCFLAESITTVTILWGGVYGLGFGLSSLLLPLIIIQNFEKRRATALGVMWFGSYLGFFILPSVTEFFIRTYGLSGTFLWISGMMLHCVPLSMLIQPPPEKSLGQQDETFGKRKESLGKREEYLEHSGFVSEHVEDTIVKSEEFMRNSPGHIENMMVNKEELLGHNNFVYKHAKDYNTNGEDSIRNCIGCSGRAVDKINKHQESLRRYKVLSVDNDNNFGKCEPSLRHCNGALGCVKEKIDKTETLHGHCDTLCECIDGKIEKREESLRRGKILSEHAKDNVGVLTQECCAKVNNAYQESTQIRDKEHVDFDDKDCDCLDITRLRDPQCGENVCHECPKNNLSTVLCISNSDSNLISNAKQSLKNRANMPQEHIESHLVCSKHFAPLVPDESDCRLLKFISTNEAFVSDTDVSGNQFPTESTTMTTSLPNEHLKSDVNNLKEGSPNESLEKTTHKEYLNPLCDEACEDGMNILNKFKADDTVHVPTTYERNLTNETSKSNALDTQNLSPNETKVPTTLEDNKNASFKIGSHHLNDDGLQFPLTLAVSKAPPSAPQELLSMESPKLDVGISQKRRSILRTKTPPVLPTEHLATSKSDVDLFQKSRSISISKPSPTSKEHLQEAMSLGELYKIFFEPVFLLVIFSYAIYGSTFIVLVTVIVDFGRDVGLLVTDGKYVIMAFSFASNVGLLGLGWVTDNGHLSLTNFLGLLFLVRSVATFALPFSSSFLLLVGVVSVQGFFEAPVVNLFPLVIADHYCEQAQVIAISSILFFCGPMYLAAPPLIGYFRDGRGSYSDLFFLMASLSLLCSVLLFLTPVLSKWRCVRNDRILRKQKS